MRCPDCSKFVSFDEPEPELNSVELDGSTLRASVRVVLKCADCGNELKDAEIEAEKEIEHDCKNEAEKARREKAGEELFEVTDDGEPAGNDRFQDKDRHGRPIKRARYMRHYYGFDLETTVKCLCCGEEDIAVATEGEESASGFNELV